ncbi:MAG: glycosyltransferase family 4 protein [Anaerolineae bacterium]
MKHLLFISWWWPYPANNGSKIRAYNLLRHLSEQYRVTLLSFAEADEGTPEQIAHMQTLCEQVERIQKPEYRPATMKATAGYLSRWPRSLVDTYSPEMARQVVAALNGSTVDVIMGLQIQTMRYLELAPQIPAILEEVETTTFRNAAEQSSGKAQRFRSNLTLSKLNNALAGLHKRGVALTVVSQAEKDYLRFLSPSGERITVVPNGVDTEANRPDPAIQPLPHTLIYTGAVTYDANYEAVEWFVKQVWPLVRARYPQARFTVTGGTGKVDVSKLAAQPGVTFSGYLPSVADSVRQSWAVLATLRTGGGTRLKILEAMALGIPVIATSKGAEGLTVKDGDNILIANTPQQVAAAVSRLFEDNALRAKLVSGGRALVEEQYDWGKLTGKLVELIEQITARRQPV